MPHHKCIIFGYPHLTIPNPPPLSVLRTYQYAYGTTEQGYRQESPNPTSATRSQIGSTVEPPLSRHGEPPSAQAAVSYLS